MSRKGLSYEEKRKRMNEFLQEKREVFTLKELESQLPKSKGIVQQSVKEVLASLQSDGLVDFDKIGSGNFYWSLPSKEFVAKRAKLEKSVALKAAANEKLAGMTERKKIAQKTRVSNPTRDAKMKKLNESRNNLLQVESELSQFAEFDPSRLSLLHSSSELARSAAVRWTENIESIVAYMKSRNEAIETAAILKHVGLPAELEDVN